MDYKQITEEYKEIHEKATELLIDYDEKEMKIIEILEDLAVKDIDIKVKLSVMLIIGVTTSNPMDSMVMSMLASIKKDEKTNE